MLLDDLGLTQTPYPTTLLSSAAAKRSLVARWWSITHMLASETDFLTTLCIYYECRHDEH